jgi:hypothetical protein
MDYAALGRRRPGPLAKAVVRFVTQCAGRSNPVPACGVSSSKPLRSKSQLPRMATATADPWPDPNHPIADSDVLRSRRPKCPIGPGEHANRGHLCAPSCGCPASPSRASSAAPAIAYLSEVRTPPISQIRRDGVSAWCDRMGDGGERERDRSGERVSRIRSPHTRLLAPCLHPSVESRHGGCTRACVLACACVQACLRVSPCGREWVRLQACVWI